jgi:hypothetical protein
MYNISSCIKGLVKEDTDGNYTVFINENLNHTAREKTVRHELRHIEKQHFRQQGRPVSELENEIET